MGNDWCGVSGSRGASGKRSCAVEEHLTFASTVRRDLQRPDASVQRFLIDCAGRRFDCRAALAFDQRVCEAVAPSSSVAAQRSESS